ncbi:MAG: ATPase [Parcubacteria group bacterium]|nr:ATPase [Parcubacteria group bacterium]
MNRISVVGISGAGKSTLSNKLGKKLNLPVFHLDKYFWAVGWKKRYETKEEFTLIVDGFVNQDKWIIDGNYTSSNIDLRFERADTIIFLDFPKYVSLWRVCVRVLDRKQPFDKTEGVKQKVDWALIKWILNYKVDEMRERIERYRNSKNIFIIKNSKEISYLLEELGGLE